MKKQHSETPGQRLMLINYFRGVKIMLQIGVEFLYPLLMKNRVHKNIVRFSRKKMAAIIFGIDFYFFPVGK